MLSLSREFPSTPMPVFIASRCCPTCTPSLFHLLLFCFSEFSSSLLLCSLVVSRHNQPQKLCPQDVSSFLCFLSLFPHIAELFKNSHHFRFPKVYVCMSVARDQMQPPAPFLFSQYSLSPPPYSTVEASALVTARVTSSFDIPLYKMGLVHVTSP